jgi:SPP1 gp7 family putative phage head morphogenesis protein
LLSGETTQQVGRRLLGQLYFGEKARTAKQLALAGGEATKMANHQISTLVRTSIQQVSDTAAQSVYKQNSDITESYKWIATLDSRTAPQCMMLDGQVFKYGQGPTPPQHFNCRCRTVATIDYEGLGIPPPNFTRSTRAAVGGPVPTGTSYGSWLQKQPPKMRAKILGGKEVTLASGKKAWRGKFQYFDKLSKKVGPDKAIAKFVSSDGSEKSLKQLQKTYGKPSNIKPKAPIKKTKLLSDKEKKTLAEFEKIKPPSKALLAKEGKYMTEAEKKGLVPYKPLTTAQKKMVDKSVVETQAKKVVSGDLKPEVATLQKLDDSTKNTLENFKKADLTNKKHQNWFMNQKLFNGTLIPKGKFDTITPKELGKLVEKKELTKLQTKYDKAFKKLLNPTPVKPKAPIKKWDDESFIQKNIGSTNKKTPPPPRLTAKQGKKSTDDLWYKSDVKDSVKNYDMTKVQFDQTSEVISNWTGTNFGEIRALQIKQAKLVGKQLNPNEIRQLKKFEMFEGRNKNTVNTIARDADRMERYIARTPKWKGGTRAVYDGKTVKLGEAFYDKQPNGTVFRGMTVNSKNIVEDVLQNIKAGEAVTTMESWSADPRIAIKFAKGEIGRGNHGLVMRHVNKHGSPIEYLNGMNESEILQPSGVRYKLISKKTKTWTKKVDGVAEDFSMTEVVLEAI